MDKEDGLRKRIQSEERVAPEICSNDSGSQSDLNKLEAQSTENALNPEKKSGSNHFLVNWCRRLFCIRQASQEPEEVEVIHYTPKNTP